VIRLTEVHDGAEVVWREVLFDEAAHESARAKDLLTADLIQRDHVQPSVGLIVRLHVGSIVPAEKSGRSVRTRGRLTRPNDVIALQAAVFEDLEVVPRQVGDHIPSRVRDRGIDFDGVDLDAERWRLRCRLRRRLREEMRTARAEDNRDGDSHDHGRPFGQGWRGGL
jgi:hypothetical protein